MYLQIKKITKTPNKYGSDLTVSMIGLYEDSGKWIKWIKLDDKVIATLLSSKITFNPAENGV